MLNAELSCKKDEQFWKGPLGAWIKYVIFYNINRICLLIWAMY